MESESKRRSGSFGSQKTAKLGGEEATRLSLSDGSIVDKESPVTSPSGTLKKPRKFKPRKFIAKLTKKKSEKSEESEGEKAEKSSIASKLSSPKLQRFNIMKRFSGRRSYQVTPVTDESAETSTDLKKRRALSVSGDEAEEDFTAVEEPPPPPSQPKESVTLESKKVQLKITISGKKVEKSGTPSPIATDKASPETTEPFLRRRADIILPASSTQLRLSASRDHFFSEMVSHTDNAGVERAAKPISDSTFAAVVKDGLSVQSTRAEGSNEVEKYLVLTSSLNSIISAAKELDDLSSKVENLKLPELSEISDLKIEEEPGSVDIAEGPAIVGFQPKDTLASSTPNKPEDEEDMKKLNRKSKIPRDVRRKSASSEGSEKEATVHTQEPQKPYNVNVSSSSSEEFKSPTGELKPEEIKFEVGTPVRPQRTSSATGPAPLAIPETPNNTDALEDSVDDVFHSPKSESSLNATSMRRKIAYVPQLSIYTAEEQEILKSNFKANATESFDSSSLPPDSSVFPVFDESAVRARVTPHHTARFVVRDTIERLLN